MRSKTFKMATAAILLVAVVLVGVFLYTYSLYSSIPSIPSIPYNLQEQQPMPQMGVQRIQLNAEMQPSPMVQGQVAEKILPIQMVEAEFNTEAYDRIYENSFLLVKDNPLSTFSIDVDTASYANVRRFLTENKMPPPDAVRIEELINYFRYDYAPPMDEAPFMVHSEVGPCPWSGDHKLVRIGLKGKEIPEGERPASNLVFLLDVSGSMRAANKLSLVKRAMKLLVEKLTEKDRVAIVVYAGASGLLLPSTECGGENKDKILEALARLEAGGSTHGSAGIKLAYEVGQENFIAGGTNRVILATDGDFNVGVTNQGDLIRLIEEKAKSGIFLTALGFGMGNLKDSTLEKLADKGNGNYGYIDTISEARKIFIEEMGGTLITIAKDVKIQVEFNPLEVVSYRLIGYENRLLRAEDFTDDTKDAGEIGAGHTVTAFYELIPPGEAQDADQVDPLKYQADRQLTEQAAAGELMTVKLRYKEPNGESSKELALMIEDKDKTLPEMSHDFRFAASVAAFGMLLRDSEHKGQATYEAVINLASESISEDPFGHRNKFVDLVRKARSLGEEDLRN
ncbi:MAG: VWA domain-containing protein [Planctomycetes bacterium]|nr:VWA domain-containing protein [Planctomycetota bacterium]